MNQNRINAITIGAFYIVAAASSIIAVALYQPILSAEWMDVVAKGLGLRILLGAVNDFILVISAIGTAVMLYPYLRRWSERVALGYLCFRFMEAVTIMIGVVGLLALLNVSTAIHSGSFILNESTRAVGTALQAFHGWTFIIGSNLMLGINTFLYSYLLMRTAIIPRLLANSGMITAAMVFIAGMLEMFGIVDTLSVAKALLALPVGVYELSLAVWLIVKGFNSQAMERLFSRS